MMNFKNNLLAITAIICLIGCASNEAVDVRGDHFYTYQLGDYGHRLQEVPINSVADYSEPVLISGDVTRMLGDGVILSGETGEIYVKISPVYENLGVQLGSHLEVIGIYDLNYFSSIEVAVEDGRFQPATAY